MRTHFAAVSTSAKRVEHARSFCSCVTHAIFLAVESSDNNQQRFTRASVIKGIRLRNYYLFTFQDLFDATFRYKDPLDIS